MTIATDEPIRPAGVTKPAIVGVALAAAGVVLGLWLHLSAPGIAALALGFSGFSFFRAFTARRPHSDVKKPLHKAWKVARIAAVVVLCLLAGTMWVLMLLNGEEFTLGLHIPLGLTFLAAAFWAGWFMKPQSRSRWFAGTLATACLGVNANLWTGNARLPDAYDIKSQPVTNWLCIADAVENALDLLRAPLGIVVAEWHPIHTAASDAARAARFSEPGMLLDAENDITRALNWSQRQTPRDDATLAAWRALRAKIRYHRDDLDNADADLRVSLDWHESRVPRDERALFDLYQTRALIREEEGDLAGAASDFNAALVCSTKVPTLEPGKVMLVYASRSRIHWGRGDRLSATLDIETALRWAEARPIDQQAEFASWFAWDAKLRLVVGGYAEAERRIEHALRLEAAKPTPSRSNIAWFSSLRAQVRTELGDLAGALTDLDTSIGILESMGGRASGRLADAYRQRAELHKQTEELGEPDETSQAEADFTRALEIRNPRSPEEERSLANDRKARGDARWFRALFYAGTEREHAAEKLTREAREDLALALQWFEQHQPNDESTIRDLRRTIESIDHTAQK